MTAHDLDSAWYPAIQLHMLRNVAGSVVDLDGMDIEVGCWKGNSTIQIAKVFHNSILCAVDTWEGSLDESPTHDTVRIAQEQNVYDIFRHNIEQAGVQERIFVCKMDWRAFFDQFSRRMQEEGIRFLHIDGSHDYQSVYDNILAAIPYMVVGGVICGDDIQTAHRGRDDLQGGVERAVSELLVGYRTFGNFWYWRKA